MASKSKRARKARPRKAANQPKSLESSSQPNQQNVKKTHSRNRKAKIGTDANTSANRKLKDIKDTTILQSSRPISTNEMSPPRPLKAQKSPFLLLPPEVRWQIYQELFHLHRVEIIRRKNRKRPNKKFKVKLIPPKPTRYRLWHRQLAPRDVQSQVVQRYPATPMPSYQQLPTALVFTCRLTYCETIHLFYSSMQFVFNCTKTTARFLKTTRKDLQSAINHVELNHIMYNEPRLTEFREYKFRSDRAWFRVCDEMSQNFESLRVLHFHMTVYDWPIGLEIGERWSFPLLVFGEHGRQLDIAQIMLLMPRFSKEKLRFVARSIEERLMKPESFQIREDERLARKLMGHVKARKILKIGF